MVRQMINPMASAVLFFGIIGMLIFEGLFFIWLIWTDHKWSEANGRAES